MTNRRWTNHIIPPRMQVYIVGHIPPGSDERQMGAQPNGHTTFSEKNNLRYLQLVRKYSSIILGQFFGHLHSDSFRIIYNDNGKGYAFFIHAWWSSSDKFQQIVFFSSFCLPPLYQLYVHQHLHARSHTHSKEFPKYEVNRVILPIDQLVFRPSYCGMMMRSVCCVCVL